MTTIVVTAAVIERGGCYLVTRRQAGVHLSGYWEFPGGKCDRNEPLQDCMVRELREELAAAVEVQDEVFTITHDYDDRRVELHFFRCTLLGDAVPQQGQDMKWVPRQDLAALQFPAADAQLIALLSEAG